MVKAILDGVVVAESENTVFLEGNHYFPPDALNREFFKETNTSTTCPFKGQAAYYTVSVPSKEVSDGAWYYPMPKSRAENIKGHVAFYKNKFEIV